MYLKVRLNTEPYVNLTGVFFIDLSVKLQTLRQALGTFRPFYTFIDIFRFKSATFAARFARINMKVTGSTDQLPLIMLILI